MLLWDSAIPLGSFRVILFGSRARGDHHHDSDVDLLIIVPRADDKRVLVAEIRRAIVHLPVAKDIVVATLDDVQQYGDVVGTVLYPALRDGKVLYDSGSQNSPDDQVA